MDRHETILIVDDDPNVLRITGNTLRLQGFPVLEATNGADALRIAIVEEASIHVVLTDVMMPEMTGYELGQKLNAMCPGLRLVFTSGHRENVGITQSLSAAFLPKPFTSRQLLSAVSNQLGARSPAVL